MVLEFYKLKKQPFGVTPDPRFLFPSATHLEALASLVYGIETRRGFLALIASPGMGKTTLLFHLLNYLRGSARTVFLFQTQCAPLDLLRYLLRDLGVETASRDPLKIHEQLNHILLREMRAGRRFVLVIDEAQNLSEPVLETARLLSNFETPGVKLVQMVLAGQPQLSEKLDRPSLSQLKQRISILARLEPFTPVETYAYIEHRIRIAGHYGPPLFTRAALELIAKNSQGIPRNINNICFNALSLGFALEHSKIGPDIVEEVIADLRFSPPEALGARIAQPAVDAAPQASAPSFGVSSADRSYLRTCALFLLACFLTVLALYLSTNSRFMRHGTISSSISPPAWASLQAVDPSGSLDGHVVAPGDNPPAAKHGTLSRLALTPEPILHVVQQGETLRRIGILYFGHWNAGVWVEIQKLNPNLLNPDQIQVGQQIRLPKVPFGAAPPNPQGEPRAKDVQGRSLE